MCERFSHFPDQIDLAALLDACAPLYRVCGSSLDRLEQLDCKANVRASFFDMVWCNLLAPCFRSIQGHVARAARGAVRSGPLRQADVLRRLQEWIPNVSRVPVPSTFQCLQELSSENLPQDICWNCLLNFEVPCSKIKINWILLARNLVCRMQRLRWRVQSFVEHDLLWRATFRACACPLIEDFVRAWLKCIKSRHSRHNWQFCQRNSAHGCGKLKV